MNNKAKEQELQTLTPKQAPTGLGNLPAGDN